MLKQWHNRNQRTKGFMIKQGFKICALIVVIIWLLFQLNHSHDEGKPHEEGSAKVFEKLKASHETRKLGRKWFQPLISKPYGLVEETEESEEPERVVEQSIGGDVDIVGHGQDRVEEEEPEEEEVEDMIDEEDKGKEEENEEIEEIEEDVSLLEDQSHNEGERDTLATDENPGESEGWRKV